MDIRCWVAIGMVWLSLLPASAQIRRADFVTLIGDTDDAMRLAKLIKDNFWVDPAARRAVAAAREAVIQSWLEDKPSADLTEQERAIIRNPEYFDRAVFTAVNVVFSGSPVTLALEWDVPPRFWPRLGAAIMPVANRVGREAVAFGRKSVRLVVRLQGAEVYRINADTDGSITIVFQYE
jgi:hypothetical protein